MKIKNCPGCGLMSSLGDIWAAQGRKLVQRCFSCGWEGKPFTPNRQKIPTAKNVELHAFSGWEYIIYDKYGHEMILSEAFVKKEKAVASLKKELEKGKTDLDGGPYTAVLFYTPETIVIKGLKFW